MQGWQLKIIKQVDLHFCKSVVASACLCHQVASLMQPTNCETGHFLVKVEISLRHDKAKEHQM
ncbi:hypothetical protein OIU85_012607 [Salix viminalis]|uniref:Uncharacterized protein n=1 Tax=Salix viminalis TaxID=40686 RepID=A0A9Q0NPN7_SALVM|nr:hypothetical protein OIU85_012607 [Salix viminalis]